jgi:hypothetical protein
MRLPRQRRRFSERGSSSSYAHARQDELTARTRLERGIEVLVTI